MTWVFVLAAAFLAASARFCALLERMPMTTPSDFKVAALGPGGTIVSVSPVASILSLPASIVAETPGGSIIMDSSGLFGRLRIAPAFASERPITKITLG